VKQEENTEENQFFKAFGPACLHMLVCKFVCACTHICLHIHVYMCVCACIQKTPLANHLKTACRKNKVPSILLDTYSKEQEMKAAQKHYIEV